MKPLLAGLVAMALAGCGGPIQREELKRGIESLGSTAADGKLTARGVARDGTKSTFVRVHARTLADTADHEAEKLADAQAGPELADAKSQAVTLAENISAAAGQLQVSPGSEARGRQVQAEFQRLSERADQLVGTL